MGKKLALVHGNTMYMFVDESVDKVDDETKCVVYNTDTESWSPELLAGSWSCRMSPWLEPTQDQRILAQSLLKEV